jgi:hypothetical protein
MVMTDDDAVGHHLYQQQLEEKELDEFGAAHIEEANPSHVVAPEALLDNLIQIEDSNSRQHEQEHHPQSPLSEQLFERPHSPMRVDEQSKEKQVELDFTVLGQEMISTRDESTMALDDSMSGSNDVEKLLTVMYSISKGFEDETYLLQSVQTSTRQETLE